jgi:hypothetical protein
VHFESKNIFFHFEKLSSLQGLFLDTIYQNVENTTTSPNGHEIYQMVVNYFEWPQNIPTFSILRSSKIYPSWDFWFENIPPANPDY